MLTIALQHRPNQQNLREDGFNTARHYLSIIQTEGQQVLFTEKMRTLRKMFSGRSWSLTRRHDGRAPVLEELERLLADLRAAGVRTTLFINPFHVDYLAVIRDAGLGPEMAAWKRALTRIAMADDAVTLWDFTTFSSLASERPAAKRGAPPLKWFWEPAHYRATLGELMLARMFGRDCLPPSLEQRALPAARGFGTLLTARGVERHLADESRALVNLPSVSRSRSDNVHGNLMPPMQHVSAGGLQ